MRHDRRSAKSIVRILRLRLRDALLARRVGGDSCTCCLPLHLVAGLSITPGDNPKERMRATGTVLIAVQIANSSVLRFMTPTPSNRARPQPAGRTGCERSTCVHLTNHRPMVLFTDTRPRNSASDSDRCSTSGSRAPAANPPRLPPWLQRRIQSGRLRQLRRRSDANSNTPDVPSRQDAQHSHAQRRRDARRFGSSHRRADQRLWFGARRLRVARQLRRPDYFAIRFKQLWKRS